ncbi:MAG TPA: hypothetical protein VGM84_28480 [Steroidobacteraceae bacterium]|jgi:hypothetical protein
MRRSRGILPLLGTVAALLGAASAHADDLIKPLVDIRARYEEVAQAGIPENADAVTMRVRLGFETRSFASTTLLAEGEAMTPIENNYRPDNAVSTYTRYPVVADPENYVVNRLSLTNTALPQTTITVGRQRIVLDDQRFVGNTGWRQNEVTFDAARLVNKTVPNLTVDVTFLNKVHRLYGSDSPQGTYKGDNYLANVSYKLPFGKLTGFAYRLDFDPIAGLTGALDPRRSSTSTYGGRFAGEEPIGSFKLGYVATFATQKPRGDNPLDFSNDYFLGELNATWKGLKVAAGDEIMRGNGIVGFVTPLATLHAFDGWADKFLTTPPNGIRDTYGSATWTSLHTAGLDSLSLTVVYHSFQAEHVSANYGDEWDTALTGKWHRYIALLKYANYTAASTTPVAIARNTSKFWAQLEYVW